MVGEVTFVDGSAVLIQRPYDRLRFAPVQRAWGWHTVGCVLVFPWYSVVALTVWQSPSRQGLGRRIAWASLMTFVGMTLVGIPLFVRFSRGWYWISRNEETPSIPTQQPGVLVTPLRSFVDWVTRATRGQPPRWSDPGPARRPSSLREQASATFGPPWVYPVIAAGEAAQRFDRQVAMASSPTARAELMNVGGSVHAAAEACWAVALRGQATERTIAELNLGSVRDRLSRVASDSDDPNVAAARHSLEDQLAVGERLTANVAKVQALLNRQVADLEAAVSHAAELVLTPHVAQQREPELSAVSDRLRAVCVAIDEVNAIEAR